MTTCTSCRCGTRYPRIVLEPRRRPRPWSVLLVPGRRVPIDRCATRRRDHPADAQRAAGDRLDLPRRPGGQVEGAAAQGVTHNAVAVESLEIAHEGLLQVPLTPPRVS